MQLTASYIFPPRPENKITPSIVGEFDNGQYLAQPKYNGSCSVIFLEETGYKVRGREGSADYFNASKFKPQFMNFEGLRQGKGTTVLCGELLNKNGLDENGKRGFNQKMILWDILAFNGEYLIGSTPLQRLKLLDELYPTTSREYKHILNIGVEGIYKAPYYESGFAELYADLVKTDIYEGIIMKKKHAKLEYGFKSANNTGWQVKCRKGTKNYTH